MMKSCIVMAGIALGLQEADSTALRIESLEPVPFAAIAMAQSRTDRHLPMLFVAETGQKIRPHPTREGRQPRSFWARLFGDEAKRSGRNTGGSSSADGGNSGSNSGGMGGADNPGGGMDGGATSGNGM